MSIGEPDHLPRFPLQIVPLPIISLLRQHHHPQGGWGMVVGGWGRYRKNYVMPQEDILFVPTTIVPNWKHSFVERRLLQMVGKQGRT